MSIVLHLFISPPLLHVQLLLKLHKNDDDDNDDDDDVIFKTNKTMQ